MSFARGLGLALMASMAFASSAFERGAKAIHDFGHAVENLPPSLLSGGGSSGGRRAGRTSGNAPPRRRAWKAARRGGGKKHLAFKGSHAKR